MFHAVLDVDFEQAMESVEFTGEDMPAHAVELFDAMLGKPQIQRMMIWGQLQGEAPRMKKLAEEHSSWVPRMATIRKAQEDGLISKHWDPQDLITMLFGLVFGWVVAPGVADNQNVTTPTRSRAAVKWCARPSLESASRDCQRERYAAQPP